MFNFYNSILHLKLHLSISSVPVVIVPVTSVINSKSFKAVTQGEKKDIIDSNIPIWDCVVTLIVCPEVLEFKVANEKG